MTIFNHVTVGSDDLEKSKKFYDAVFEPLGIKNIALVPGMGAFYGVEKPEFFVMLPINKQSACHANGGTVAFKAPSREAVRAFHKAGQAAGGTDEGAPGNREQGPPGNYVAYLRDPYGNKIVAVTYAPE